MMKYPIIGMNVSDVKIKRNDPLKRTYICHVGKHLTESQNLNTFFLSTRSHKKNLAIIVKKSDLIKLMM